jgi:ABC-type branched-subunit amino acid transport system permease subunit
VGVLPPLTLLAAVALVLVLDLFVYRSRVGARIRAASDDVAAANLIELSTPRIFALAMSVAGATAAVSACFMGMRMNFDPTSGPSRLLIAFETVVLGGLGSLGAPSPEALSWAWHKASAASSTPRGRRLQGTRRSCFSSCCARKGYFRNTEGSAWSGRNPVRC